MESSKLLAELRADFARYGTDETLTFRQRENVIFIAKVFDAMFPTPFVPCSPREYDLLFTTLREIKRLVDYKKPTAWVEFFLGKNLAQRLTGTRDQDQPLGAATRDLDRKINILHWLATEEISPGSAPLIPSTN